MGWEDIQEIPAASLHEELQALLAKEAEYQRYRPAPPDADSSDEAGRMASIRQQVCQWNYEWVDYFLAQREVVHLSMNFFDRYLAARRGQRPRDGGAPTRTAVPVPSEELVKLLALTSLYLACKRQGAVAATHSLRDDTEDEGEGDGGPSRSRTRTRFRLQDFCDLSGGTFSPQKIEYMELWLLAALRWRLHPPTPTDFLCRFAKLLSLSLQDCYGDEPPRPQDPPQDQDQDEDAPRPATLALGDDGHRGGWSVFELARYQVELSAYSPELCHHCPASAVALAALLNAVDANVAGTDRPAVPARVRVLFLHRLARTGGGCEIGIGGGDAAATVHRARMALQALCPPTIALVVAGTGTGQDQDEGQAPPTLEYELPKGELSVEVFTSPVGVDSDLL